MKRLLLMAVTWCACTPLASAQSQPAAEAKLLDELYGKRITEVLATADMQDNIALAREMIQAATDEANPGMLRHLIALQVIRLASPVGTDDAARLAKDALGIADKLQPLKPLAKAELVYDMTRSRYENARKTNQPSTAAAEEYLAAMIAYAKALVDEGKADQANSTLLTAKAVAKACRLGETDVDQAIDDIRVLKARTDRMAKAEQVMAKAKDSGSPEQLKLAKEAMGQLYLVLDGDLRKAHGYLAGSGNVHEACVKAAAEFMDDHQKVPPPDVCNSILEGLSVIIKLAENKKAQSALASAGQELCKASLAASPSGLAATKTRLLLVQMEKLAGDSPADKLLKKLRSGYNGLEAQVEVLATPAGTARFSYDFSNVKQAGDWEAKEGKWNIVRTGGKDIFGGSGSSTFGTGKAYHKLRFAANKPLLLSFRASGKYHLGGLLIFQGPYTTHDTAFIFGAYRNSESMIRDSGWQTFSNREAKVDGNTIYRIDIAWDGAKGLKWTINGKQLAEVDSKFREDLTKASITVGLETYDQSVGFGDLKIEGTVLEDPSERPRMSGARGSSSSN